MITESMALAQVPELLKPIEVINSSGLTATVRFSAQGGDCAAPSGDPLAVGCDGNTTWPFVSIVSADGSVYDADIISQDNCNEGTQYMRLVRVTPNKSIQEVLRVQIFKCLECSANVCTHRLLSGFTTLFDATNGLLHLTGSVQERDGSGNLIANDRGWVVISGFPTMFDTLLSFDPGGQSMRILAPAMPDGFRSADSLQVWTGDLRTLPDWTQAQPLACTAATSPPPGQVVTVSDGLPDPAVGHGRYYLVASQSGQDRRLGRQFVNGAFSARPPALLPGCQ